MNPGRERDYAKGIRQFLVGTGGGGTKKPTQDIALLSEACSATDEVLKPALYPDRYAWGFVPNPGFTFTDKGSGTCR